MTFEERKTLAIAIMDSKKMWKSNYAPPLLRGLWKLGLKIPPFPFIPFWKNFVGFGLFFGIGWGTIMWFVSWKDMGMFPYVAVIFSSLAGIFFGFWMATFHWWRKRVNKLPDWKNWTSTETKISFSKQHNHIHRFTLLQRETHHQRRL